MKKLAASFITILFLSGCATIHMEAAKEEPVALKPRENLIEKLPELDGPSMTIAVYGFADKTGQMKPNDRLAVFSKAVTQGAEVFLIKSLQDSKNWFKVVERVGLDNLVKERQLIRNQREVYEGKDAKPLRPMTVAGIMIEGGIIGYDSNIRSGGNGARFLGIGGSQQYRVDEVVISLRLVSVNSGEVLITNAVTKTIYSTQHNVGVLRFVDAGTKSLELENGMALNEPTTYAVRVAIEQAVYEMIVEGEKKGLWRFKKPKPIVEPAPVVSVPEKKEDKKDELVQPQTAPQGRIETAPAAQQSDDGKTDGGNEKVSEVRNSTETNTPVPETQKRQGVIQDWVNIRTQKFRASETLAKLPPGTTVEVINLEQWFALIRYERKEGWIPIQFIKVLP
jgi:curli production assembly/transport component CsgG